jgi:hypothetical protein
VNDNHEKRDLNRSRLHDCIVWLSCAAITSCAALIGVSFGKTFLHDRHPDSSVVNSLSNWDGEFFNKIVDDGYFYDPRRGSTVAFYPAFPLVGKAVAGVSGLSSAAALAIVANVCCLGAFVLMGVYLRGRLRQGGTLTPALSQREREKERPHPGPLPVGEGELLRSGADSDIETFTLLAMGLLPTTFFFRMAYTESMFLCAANLAMLVIARRWPLPLVAALVGLATATRPVGVALLLPLVWYVWQISATKRQFALRLAYALPLGCWGLIAFMVYQYLKFGEPFAFVLTQKDWHIRSVGTFGDKLISLASWEPIWGAYVPSSPGYFREPEGIACPLFSLQAANPIYLVGSAGLIVAGAWKRWLTTPEVLFSAAAIAIPYLTRGYEMCMASQGRFAAVAFPVYIVLGHLLARLPTVVAGAILAFSAFLMAVYAALFAAGYSLI